MELFNKATQNIPVQEPQQEMSPEEKANADAVIQQFKSQAEDLSKNKLQENKQKMMYDASSNLYNMANQGELSETEVADRLEAVQLISDAMSSSQEQEVERVADENPVEPEIVNPVMTSTGMQQPPRAPQPQQQPVDVLSNPTDILSIFAQAAGDDEVITPEVMTGGGS